LAGGGDRSALCRRLSGRTRGEEHDCAARRPRAARRNARQARVPRGRHDAAAGLACPYFFAGFQSATTAPVGSWRTLNHPYCATSLTTLRMVAPSDLAFLVDAATSSTMT